MTADSKNEDELYEAHDEGATMVRNEKTGGQKQSKLARFDLIPPAVLKELAELYGHGVKFYSARNWEAGYDWGLSYAAAQRHMEAFWGGEELDKETGVRHTVCAMWHMTALTHFQSFQKYQELDDRPEVLEPVIYDQDLDQSDRLVDLNDPDQLSLFADKYLDGGSND